MLIRVPLTDTIEFGMGYYLTCNNCSGRLPANPLFVATDKGALLEMAKGQGWIAGELIAFCPRCITMEKLKEDLRRGPPKTDFSQADDVLQASQHPGGNRDSEAEMGDGLCTSQQ
jgi:hypothetical protein